MPGALSTGFGSSASSTSSRSLHQPRGRPSSTTSSGPPVPPLTTVKASSRPAPAFPFGSSFSGGFLTKSSAQRTQGQSPARIRSRSVQPPSSARDIEEEEDERLRTQSQFVSNGPIPFRPGAQAAREVLKEGRLVADPGPGGIARSKTPGVPSRDFAPGLGDPEDEDPAHDDPSVDRSSRGRSDARQYAETSPVYPAPDSFGEEAAAAQHFHARPHFSQPDPGRSFDRTEQAHSLARQHQHQSPVDQRFLRRSATAHGHPTGFAMGIPDANGSFDDQQDREYQSDFQQPSLGHFRPNATSKSAGVVQAVGLSYAPVPTLTQLSAVAETKISELTTRSNYLANQCDELKKNRASLKSEIHTLRSQLEMAQNSLVQAEKAVDVKVSKAKEILSKNNVANDKVHASLRAVNELSDAQIKRSQAELKVIREEIASLQKGQSLLIDGQSDLDPTVPLDGAYQTGESGASSTPSLRTQLEVMIKHGKEQQALLAQTSKDQEEVIEKLAVASKQRDEVALESTRQAKEITLLKDRRDALDGEIKTLMAEQADLIAESVSLKKIAREVSSLREDVKRKAIELDDMDEKVRLYAQHLEVFGVDPKKLSTKNVSLEEHAMAHRNMQDQLADATFRLEAAVMNLKQAEADSQRAAKQYKETLAKLEREKKELETTIEGLRVQLGVANAKIESIAEMQQERERLQKEIMELRARDGTAVSIAQEKDTRIKELKASEEELRTTNHELQLDLSKAVNAKDAEALVASLQADLKTAQNASKRGLPDSPSKEVNQQLSALKQEKLSLDKEVKNLKLDKADLQSQLDRARAAAKENAAVQNNKLGDLEQELKAVQAELDHERRKPSGIVERYELRKPTPEEKDESAKDMGDLRNKLKTAEASLGKANDRCKELETRAQNRAAPTNAQAKGSASADPAALLVAQRRVLELEKGLAEQKTLAEKVKSLEKDLEQAKNCENTARRQEESYKAQLLKEAAKVKETEKLEEQLGNKTAEVEKLKEQLASPVPVWKSMGRVIRLMIQEQYARLATPHKTPKTPTTTDPMQTPSHAASQATVAAATGTSAHRNGQNFNPPFKPVVPNVTTTTPASSSSTSSRSKTGQVLKKQGTAPPPPAATAAGRKSIRNQEQVGSIDSDLSLTPPPPPPSQYHKHVRMVSYTDAHDGDDHTEDAEDRPNAKGAGQSVGKKRMGEDDGSGTKPSHKRTRFSDMPSSDDIEDTIDSLGPIPEWNDSLEAVADSAWGDSQAQSASLDDRPSASTAPGPTAKRPKRAVAARSETQDGVDQLIDSDDDAQGGPAAQSKGTRKPGKAKKPKHTQLMPRRSSRSNSTAPSESLGSMPPPALLPKRSAAKGKSKAAAHGTDDGPRAPPDSQKPATYGGRKSVKM